MKGEGEMRDIDKLLLEIYRVDKTPEYGYLKKNSDKTKEGELAGIGKRWLTPREIIQNHFGGNFWELWIDFKKEKGIFTATKID